MTDPNNAIPRPGHQSTATRFAHAILKRDNELALTSNSEVPPTVVPHHQGSTIDAMLLISERLRELKESVDDLASELSVRDSD